MVEKEKKDCSLKKALWTEEQGKQKKIQNKDK